MQPDQLLTQIRQQLVAASDPVTQANSHRYFKEEVNFLGVTAVKAQQIGQAQYKHVKAWDKVRLFDLCDRLWQTGYFEESIIACNWSYAVRREFVPGDIDRFEYWLNHYVSNWASCDTLCNHTIGALIEQYPTLVDHLFTWTQSSNRWVKRAAAVSLILPARRGKFKLEIFTIADQLLLDQDDLVQKGYGWLLKAASQADTQAVFDYVLRHKKVMPRTALRYAIEKMPPALKAQAMAK